MATDMEKKIKSPRPGIFALINNITGLGPVEWKDFNTKKAPLAAAGKNWAPLASPRLLRTTSCRETGSMVAVTIPGVSCAFIMNPGLSPLFLPFGLYRTIGSRPHFSDEETETQRYLGDWTQSHTARRCGAGDLNDLNQLSQERSRDGAEAQQKDQWRRPLFSPRPWDDVSSVRIAHLCLS